MRFLWWRLRTRLRLLRPSVRRELQARLLSAPELHNARHYADASESAFETLAGYYNDGTFGGFMTAELARKIYREGKRNESRRNSQDSEH